MAIKAAFVSFVQCATEVISCKKKQNKTGKIIRKTETPVKGHYQHEIKTQHKRACVNKTPFKDSIFAIFSSFPFMQTCSHSYNFSDTQKLYHFYLVDLFVLKFSYQCTFCALHRAHIQPKSIQTVERNHAHINCIPRIESTSSRYLLIDSSVWWWCVKDHKWQKTFFFEVECLSVSLSVSIIQQIDSKSASRRRHCVAGHLNHRTIACVMFSCEFFVLYFQIINSLLYRNSIFGAKFYLYFTFIFTMPNISMQL